MATYEVIGFDKINGVLLVSFDANMPSLTIDVPLNDEGKYITGADLDSYIQGFIPTWHIERVNKIAAGIPNSAEIEALVVTPTLPEEIAELTPITLSEAEERALQWQEYETEKVIAKALIKWGLLTEDPTSIPNTTL